MLPLFFVLFVGMPILEIYVIIQVGQEIGALWTVGLLVVDSLIGAWLIRSQGRIVWRRFSEALAAGRPPAREVLDGALVILGGALGLAPGFVTDAFGLFLILPPTRAIVRKAIVRRLLHHGAMRVGFAARPATGRPYDVDGTAHDEADPRRLP
jgi:UPF0716 protein FxsA